MKIGIDLGTSYSLVATVHPNGQPVLIPDFSEADVFQTPSVVTLTPAGTFVGQMVEGLLEQQPDLPALRFFKRRLGDETPVHYDAQGAPWYAEALAAVVLKKLRFDAESYAGTRVESAVITVPAHFDDRQRRSVLAAASLADLPVLGLLDEPVAAAIHAGLEAESDASILLVFDLGGGTFDVSVLARDARGLYVLAKHGLTDLGGKEFDERMASLVLERAGSELGDADSLGARALLDLRRESEALKIALCRSHEGVAARTVVLGHHALHVEVTRAAFDSATADLIEMTLEATRQCLAGASLRPADIGAVLLVGGGTLVPAVADGLRRVFPDESTAIRHHDPSRAVALGAALHAARLSGDPLPGGLPPELRGVTGHAVGIRMRERTSGRVGVDTLVRRNAPLPACGRRSYFAHRADQDRILLEVVQYRDDPEDYVTLGRLEVEAGPGRSPSHPVDVEVECRADGTVAVTAKDPRTEETRADQFRPEDGGELERLAGQRTLLRSCILNNL